MTPIQLENIEIEKQTSIKIDHGEKSNYGYPTKNALTPKTHYDFIGHAIIVGTTRRCRLCRNTTIYICLKCNTHLHIKCFKQFHSPK